MHNSMNSARAQERRWRLGGIAVLLAVFAAPLAAQVRTLQANPQNLASQLSKLQAGDTLVLEPGIYAPLKLAELNGRPDAWITVTGANSPDGTGATVIGGTPCTPHGGRCDVVTIFNSSYLAVKKLRIDGGGGTHSGFGINATGGLKNHVHDILIEDNVLLGLHASQQNDGISTKAPTWNWTIRGNKIFGAGTGLYLGNSDGTDPFIHGVIENNLVQGPIGYDMEIKYQKPWPKIPGMPTGPTVTIIRNNTFIKGDNPSPDGDRPNVLVGGFPESGPGSQNMYEIYGNFFYHNPREALLQVTGRVTIHDNILVGGQYAALDVEAHNGPVKLVHIYDNTIYTSNIGIDFKTPGPAGTAVLGNLVFAKIPVSGSVPNSPGMTNNRNLTTTPDKANYYVKSPSYQIGFMNFYPLPGQVRQGGTDLSRFQSETDYDLDFNGTRRVEKNTRSGKRTVFSGAYAGEGFNTGWKLQAGIKPEWRGNESHEPVPR